ncbi:cobalamin biosynthesis protein [Corynebacterium sp. 13CS0277]|uniref:CobD/CbiB family cobalamin biosynthesis protein n=1 Tax=Corynebacterium sp. 13CS0277 TaxID=2071994 RepID=UPI000D041B65|nr:CobD/CbiB family cobalamin biosynthesis protein [Corynebacterium sp. 13CS0277]PRQ10717.1 cobalamin biosynthesis protein [Corynebacterium sp. 13CS0277]
MTTYLGRAVGIAVGVAADRILPDPTHHHPVALFGRYATWVERHTYRPTTTAGAVYVAATCIPPVVATAWLAKVLPRPVVLAASLWAALGAATLERTGTHMHAALAAGDEDAARGWVPWLCSRDPEHLDAAGMARATVESLAENTSDATIAPIVWAALAGAPGVVLHRCVNTLDAMVGYRNERYSRFGTAAARLDDVLAWIPARLTAMYHVLLAGENHAVARQAWREQASAHPSPNAGPVEATAAGALGVRLGGTTIYPHGVEHRPELGYGPAPTTDTIPQAVRLARRTELLAAADAIGDLLACHLLRSRRKRRHR